MRLVQFLGFGSGQIALNADNMGKYIQEQRDALRYWAVQPIHRRKAAAPL